MFRKRMETLRAAYDSKLDQAATRRLWRIFRRDFQFDAMNIQKRCVAEASGSSGCLLEADDGRCHTPKFAHHIYSYFSPSDFSNAQRYTRRKHAVSLLNNNPQTRVFDLL